jgi:hypothetical protein
VFTARLCLDRFFLFLLLWLDLSLDQGGDLLSQRFGLGRFFLVAHQARSLDRARFRHTHRLNSAARGGIEHLIRYPVGFLLIPVARFVDLELGLHRARMTGATKGTRTRAGQPQRTRLREPLRGLVAQGVLWGQYQIIYLRGPRYCLVRPHRTKQEAALILNRSFHKVGHSSVKSPSRQQIMAIKVFG